MKNLRTFGTGATVATFAVMAVSGAALFFGLRGGNLKLIHEYVGAAMIIACVLHIIVNFKAFTAQSFMSLKKKKQNSVCRLSISMFQTKFQFTN